VSISSNVCCRYPAKSRMHILAYMYGLAYYMVLSITFVNPTTIRAALHLVFSKSCPSPTGDSSTIQQQSCAITVEDCLRGGACGDRQEEQLYPSLYGLVDEALALDSASAATVVASVFETILNTLVTDKMILLVRILVLGLSV
jgi:hypothetical protein